MTTTTLIENTLWGTRDLVETAIERLRSFEPPDGYWLGFSGGKDSQVIYDLALKAGVRFEAHFSLTTVDPPEVVKFVKEHYPEVSIDRPPKTMWQLIVENGMPPTRLARYCCRLLKERGGDGRLVLTGVRWAESVRRRGRQMYEHCFQEGRKFYLHPIIDWSDDMVWEYHRRFIPHHCSLYDEGWDRIGCILCPMSHKVERDVQRWPKYAEAYRRACRRAWQKRHDRGDTLTWADGDAMYEWWLKRDVTHVDDAQCVLFPLD
jgi:phosphoadenosine phosphosulfate reductase